MHKIINFLIQIMMRFLVDLELCFLKILLPLLKILKKSLVGNGRLTFVCWSNREENDWINLSSNVASQFLELPPKANPKDPGPFAFEDYSYIKEILIKAGWKNIKIKNHIRKKLLLEIRLIASRFLK